jgi:hypothetical protein
VRPPRVFFVINTEVTEKSHRELSGPDVKSPILAKPARIGHAQDHCLLIH